MNVVFLQFTLRDQGPLHRTELRALWNASLGEHSTQETINVEDERQTGTGLSHHRPVQYGVQGPVFQTHGWVSSITFFTP